MKLPLPVTRQVRRPGLLRLACLVLLLVVAADAARAQTPSTPGATDESTPLPPLPPGIIANPGSYTPRVGGYVQARETYRDGPGLTAFLNRARITIEGPLPHSFTYRVQAEYEAPAANPITTAAGVSLRDAYVRWAYRNFAATAGQFKVPFSREFLMSITTLETPDRAALELLGPRRDLGVMAEYLLVPDVTVSAGVFNGEGQNASVNRDSTVMFAARVAGRPVPQVSLGAATTVSGSDSTRVGLEAGLDLLGVSLRGEFVHLTRDIGPEDQGWYALATVRAYAGLSLVVRQEATDRGIKGPLVTSQEATTVGGFFDFPGGKLRAWLDYVHRTTEGPASTQNSVQAQFQARF